ncbi:MAG: hypothetical protein ACFCUW_12570 [Kiloniellaceae bacterium]
MIETLTGAEQRLIAAAREGKPANFASGDPDDDDPANGESWGIERQLRAEIVKRLCLGLEEEWSTDAGVVHIQGAAITGSLNLESANSKHAVRFSDCYFDREVEIDQARFVSLSLPGCYLRRGLSATFVRVDGSLRLNRAFRSESAVDLIGAKIGGQLLCNGATFVAENGVALAADGIVVDHGIFLSDGFRAEGEVRLIGAKVSGTLSFDDAKFINEGGVAIAADRISVRGSVYLEDGFSAIGEVRFNGAEIRGNLSCGGGTIRSSHGCAFQGDTIEIRGNLFLGEGFSAIGQVRLNGAQISGQILCHVATIEGYEGIAFVAEGIHVGGDVFFTSGHFSLGVVSLAGATIGGALLCDNSSFVNPSGLSISAIGAQVKQEVRLSHEFKSEGCVDLRDAEIGEFRCETAHFENSSGVSILAPGLKVRGNVRFGKEFLSKGSINFASSNIGGMFWITRARFENYGETAFLIDRIRIVGSIIFEDGFSSRGSVSCCGSTIEGQFVCRGTICDGDGYALRLNGSTVQADVFLANGLTVIGGVSLPGLTVGGSLLFSGGSFQGASGPSIWAEGISVKQDLLMTKAFSSDGEINLSVSWVGGDVVCSDALFVASELNDQQRLPCAVRFTGLRVDGRFLCRRSKFIGGVFLNYARVSVLADAKSAWPDSGMLVLDGCEYQSIGINSPVSFEDREEWLGLQQAFRSQPYEHLSRLLRHIGHERDAKKVAIAKQIQLRKSGLLTRKEGIWSHILEQFVGYGYEPWRVLIGAAVLVGAGASIFDLGYSSGLITPADSRVFLHTEYIENGGNWLPPEYVRFNAILFSFDVFLPIVDLHQESHWLPNMKGGWGWVLWVVMWIHISLGWLLTSIFVAALAGIIKRD